MAEATNEEILARFIDVYGQTERGKHLWDDWMAALNETGRGLVEQLAQSAAEDQGIPLEEARLRLAAEKLVQDRGFEYAQKYLNRHDAANLTASRSLKPMATPRKKSR